MMDETKDTSGTEPGLTEPNLSSDPRTVPLAALTSERKKRQSLESELSQLRAEAQERSEREATERGEFRELWETRGKPSEEKVSQLETRLLEYETKRAERQQQQLEALGDFGSDIPEGIKGDALDSLLTWTENLKRRTEASSTSSAPIVPSGKGSQDGTKPSSIVSEKEAQWMRLTKPSWLNASEERQRSLLDKFGPSWARNRN